MDVGLAVGVPGGTAVGFDVGFGVGSLGRVAVVGSRDLGRDGSRVCGGGSS